MPDFETNERFTADEWSEIRELVRRTEQCEGPVKVILKSHNRVRGRGRYERLDVKRKMGVDGIDPERRYSTANEFSWSQQVEIFRMMKSVAPERVRAIEAVGFDHQRRGGCLGQAVIIGAAPVGLTAAAMWAMMWVA